MALPLTLSVEPEGLTESEYISLLEEARAEQLRLAQEHLERMQQRNDRMMQAIIALILLLPLSLAGRTTATALQGQLNVLQGVDRELESFRADFPKLLDIGMLDAAQQVVSREARIANLMGQFIGPGFDARALQLAILSDGTELSVRVGTLAQEAVNAARNRYYRDGINLSDRLVVLSRDTRRLIEETIVQGLGAGAAPEEIAKVLKPLLMEAGERNPRYRAGVIARTELNTAYREAYIKVAIDPATGRLRKHIASIAWRLSGGHKLRDECDLYASDDTGLGPGNYLPEYVPTSHPQCLCQLYSILVSIPTTDYVVMKPDTSTLTDAQIARMAFRDGNAPAQRLLAQRQSL